MTDFNQGPQQPQQNPNQYQPEDKLSTILTIVSFCVPIVGAVLYFVNKDTKPQSAKTACYAALAGFGVGVVVQILWTVFGAAASM